MFPPNGSLRANPSNFFCFLSAITAPSMKTAPSQLEKRWWIFFSLIGFASEDIGIRAEAFQLIYFTKQTWPPRACGFQIKLCQTIVVEANAGHSAIAALPLTNYCSYEPSHMKGSV